MGHLTASVEAKEHTGRGDLKAAHAKAGAVDQKLSWAVDS
jgi:hypothetical protein